MGRVSAYRPAPSFGARVLHHGAGTGRGAAGADASGDPDRELVWAALEEYPHGTRWFTELVTIHWDCVWALCQAALLDEKAAESAAKLAFLRVHRRLGRYRFEQRFTAWMCGIAREVLAEALAELNRASGPGPGSVSWMRSWVARESGRRALGRGFGGSPRRAFAALEREQRQLLALQCVEGLSNEEVAAAVGVEPARLTERLEAARARLAEGLGPPSAASGRGHGAAPDRSRGAGALDSREAAAVRAALGEPDRERIVRAMDEIERQVALEDVVVLLIRSVVEASQEFFEVMGQVYPAGAEPTSARSLGERS